MEEKTLLQRIVAQTEIQIARTIEEAIGNGAVINRVVSGSAYIDGLFVQKSLEDTSDAIVVLELKSEKIKKALMDDADTLAMRKESLIRQIAEIDKQLNLIEK